MINKSLSDDKSHLNKERERERGIQGKQYRVEVIKERDESKPRGTCLDDSPKNLFHMTRSVVEGSASRQTKRECHGYTN